MLNKKLNLFLTTVNNSHSENKIKRVYYSEIQVIKNDYYANFCWMKSFQYIITFQDEFPTENDIWQALERLIVYNYVRENFEPSTNTTENLMSRILLPEYILGEFANVTRGNQIRNPVAII